VLGRLISVKSCQVLVLTSARRRLWTPLCARGVGKGWRRFLECRPTVQFEGPVGRDAESPEPDARVSFRVEPE
jgi:hypothetical protein